jgi:hypothetical protein
VTFTATVVGAAPTGTVNFKDGGTTIAGCGTSSLSGSGNSRAATCSTSSLAVGVHSIVASYTGDAGNLASASNTLSQVINAAGGGSSSNVALASVGAVASASSTFAGYPLVTVNDNARAGVGWNQGGGGWADGDWSRFAVDLRAQQQWSPVSDLFAAGCALLRAESCGE